MRVLSLLYSGDQDIIGSIRSRQRAEGVETFLCPDLKLQRNSLE